MLQMLPSRAISSLTSALSTWMAASCATRLGSKSKISREILQTLLQALLHVLPRGCENLFDLGVSRLSNFSKSPAWRI